MKYFRFIILFFFIYLLLVFPFVGRPLVVDEIHLAKFARVTWSFANLGPGAHPPFYIDILRFFSQVFDINGSNLRIVGIICFLLNLVLIYRLSEEIFKDKKRGILASLIFALHPLAIQGSMVLDIDNTILTVMLTLTCLYYVKNINNFKLKNAIFLTLFFFASLWAKLGTPFILMGSLILFHLFKKENIRAFKIFLVSLCATVIFLLFWKIDSMVFNFPFSIAFERGFSVISGGGIALPRIQELALRILRVTLWLGPYLVILWAAIIAGRIKTVIAKREQLNLNDFLIIYSGAIFVFYILIGGPIFGFAKYHYPMLPVLSIIIANTIVGLDLNNLKKHFVLYGFFGIVFVAISYIFSGDLLYQINYNLRQIAIFAPQGLPGFYKDFARRAILYFSPFVVGFFVIRLMTRKENWFRIFSFLAITFIMLGNLSSDIYLRDTKYFTTYCYGRDIGDFKRVVKICEDIAKKDKDARIIAPNDILEHAKIEIFIGYHEFWNDRDKFLQLVKNKNVSAIIYNPSYNALYSYKEIFFNPAVEAALKKDYKLLVLGTHDIWIRKR